MAQKRKAASKQVHAANANFCDLQAPGYAKNPLIFSSVFPSWLGIHCTWFLEELYLEKKHQDKLYVFIPEKQ